MIVPAVGSPADVKQVAKNWHEANDDLDSEVGYHARDGNEGNAAEVGGEYDDAAGEAAEQVADARNEPDNAVEAEADVGSGNAEPGVEGAGEQVEVFIAKSAPAAAQA